MRISLRLIISLILVVGVVSFFFAYFQVETERQSLRKELEVHAGLVAGSLEEALGPQGESRSQEDLQRVVERFARRERPAGIGVFDEQGRSIAVTPGLAAQLEKSSPAVKQALASKAPHGEFLDLGSTPLYLYVQPLPQDDSPLGALAVLQDASSLEAQSSRLWQETLRRVLVQTLLIALITLLIIRIGIMRPIARTAQRMRALRTGSKLPEPAPPEEDLFEPLMQEVTQFAKSLDAARAAAEKEARLRQTAESLWTPERLRVHVKSKLREKPLFVVSNREPYMHLDQGKGVEVIVPASGLVTALEPILRACDGTWVAHGSGSGDRLTVDQHDRLRVPPEQPQYTLRRVWLSKEEEEGYYSGFSNEGMWPLCHIAHTRPAFRASDWEQYQTVNRKFAQAVHEEMVGTEDPAVLVQDYHFALLPRLLKEKRPEARVAIFWHIPWPNPEAFGICPWERELLDGLLGADLVGFHIQAHCLNFLETVSRALECRVEWERFAVNRNDHLTLVRALPISVAFTDQPAQKETTASGYPERGALLRQLGVEAPFVGVGVDRADYTKGILERFRGVERFLEKYPRYQRQFTFIQIGAPSRTMIKRYNDFLGEIDEEAKRINGRFPDARWKPIVLVSRHHSHREIDPLYKAANLCLVTSLHDGMNLVAKEFVAAREDEQGALILSRFTGACRELHDALIVNPYDTEQLAEAIRTALEMDPEERRARMRRLRHVVRDHNIYRWAANLISELSDIRLERPEPIKSG